ncbi:MAG TPA: hypothetical protein VK581_13860 [Chthoniobacterales bacterium]|nr:hypothetical protein [Chthoniobacterales bacterium]
MRILKQYRIEDAAARAVVEETFSKDRKLRDIWKSGKPAAEIKRTRIFARATVEAKRNTYAELRRYSTDKERQAALIAQLETALTPADIARLSQELARSHASTRERYASRVAFYTELQSLIGSPRCDVVPRSGQLGARGVDGKGRQGLDRISVLVCYRHANNNLIKTLGHVVVALQFGIPGLQQNVFQFLENLLLIDLL